MHLGCSANNASLSRCTRFLLCSKSSSAVPEGSSLRPGPLLAKSTSHEPSPIPLSQIFYLKVSNDCYVRKIKDGRTLSRSNEVCSVTFIMTLEGFERALTSLSPSRMGTAAGVGSKNVYARSIFSCFVITPLGRRDENLMGMDNTGKGSLPKRSLPNSTTHPERPWSVALRPSQLSTRRHSCPSRMPEGSGTGISLYAVARLQVVSFVGTV